jgi:CRISPR-associated protein Csb2
MPPQAFLHLSAHLPTQRYHPQEWPPAPARVFQALLAGVTTGAFRQTIAAQSLEPLRWLEQLDPPWISAPQPQILNSYRISVPNNDLDKAARAWAKGDHAEPAKLRTLKTIAPRELAQAGPHVHYFWPLNSAQHHEAQRHFDALLQTVHCLHTLGWGIDMAFADLTLEFALPAFPEGFELWQPGPRGISLAVPIPGFLSDLEACYSRFRKRISPAGVNADTRPRHYGIERYQRVGRQERAYCAFALRPLVESSSSFFRHPPHRSVDVAAWVRHAALQALPHQPETQPWLSYISGHTQNSDPSQRLSYVPLPSIGAAKADAFIRRILLLESWEADGAVTEFLATSLNGAALTDPSGRPRCTLSPLDEQDMLLRQYLPPFGARVWHSVTPVILHGYNTQRRQLSLEKTDKLLCEAFFKSGYPDDLIADFFIQSAPLVPQLPGATQFFLPEHLRRFPRYHVGVRFHEPVHGPLTVGIGRHCGLGLFRPIRE